MTTKTLLTAEELLNLPKQQRCELINGELIEMSPSGYWHAHILFLIGAKLQGYLEQNPIGMGFGGEGGFLISRDPDTVRAPDVAFVLRERVPEQFETGYFPGSPDLAVEVISPRDASTEVAEKVAMWLQAGTRVVWTVDPQRKRATIHELDHGDVVSRESAQLSCETLLPGLTIAVEEILS